MPIIPELGSLRQEIISNLRLVWVAHQGSISNNNLSTISNANTVMESTKKQGPGFIPVSSKTLAVSGPDTRLYVYWGE